jgi:hypothetical protein
MSRNQYGFQWLQSSSTKTDKKDARWTVNIYGAGDAPIPENNIYCTTTSLLDIAWIANTYPLWAYDVYVTPIAH